MEKGSGKTIADFDFFHDKKTLIFLPKLKDDPFLKFFKVKFAIFYLKFSKSKWEKINNYLSK